MGKKGTAAVPAKLREALERELGAHMKGHMKARHFEHIEKLHAAPRKPSTSRKQPSFKVREHLRVYTGTIGKVARHGLSGVEPGGRTLLVESANGLITQVEAMDKDKAYSVVRVSSGTAVSELQNALDRARKASGRRANQVDFRLLSVPAMHTLTVWAHDAKSPARDVFVPVLASFGGLHRRHSYRRSTIEKTLKRQGTEAILNWYERLQSGPGPK